MRLLEAVEYDIGLASRRLLGKDAARIVAPSTRAQIVALLDDPVGLEKLAKDMARGLSQVEDRVAVAAAVIAQFRIGIGNV